jgi:aminoglycoside 2''-phosphotransferase
MTDATPDWTARVRAVMPDLAIEQVEVNQEGLINDVVIVNGRLVFRFAKNEEKARILETELDLLDYVRPRVNLPIPAPIQRGPGFAVYPLIAGQPLRLEDLLDLDPAGQTRLAGQIGAFLHGLHSLPTDRPGLPVTRAIVTVAEWLDFLADFRKRAYPLLQAHQIHWIERLFDKVVGQAAVFDYAPAIIHGDFAPYHILYDPAETRVCGIIDFGMAGLGDPASDFGILISLYGETFVARMGAAYPNLEAVLPRARFYAQTIELEWVQRGLETGETFWFLGHLGGARDIRQA